MPSSAILSSLLVFFLALTVISINGDAAAVDDQVVNIYQDGTGIDALHAILLESSRAKRESEFEDLAVGAPVRIEDFAGPIQVDGDASGVEMFHELLEGNRR